MANIAILTHNKKCFQCRKILDKRMSSQKVLSGYSKSLDTGTWFEKSKLERVRHLFPSGTSQKRMNLLSGIGHVQREETSSNHSPTVLLDGNLGWIAM